MIKALSRHSYFYVGTDDADFPDHRRLGPDNWEVRMGESWETCSCEELEKDFQEHIKELDQNFP